MSTILISIKPEYVKKILNGKKRYEYRKVKPARKNISKMLIYSTTPVKLVVAEAEIESILEDDVKKIWKDTKCESGITKKIYDSYYKNCSKAIAYKLKKVTIYEKPQKLEDIGVKCVPQSFIYFD